MTNGLSQTEQNVYTAAIALLGTKPYPPTFVEVAEKAGVGEATANRAIRHLVELGALTFDPKAKRSLGKGKPLSKLKKKKASA